MAGVRQQGKLRVFISHSRADEAFADDLRLSLEYDGFAVEIDKHSIHSGEDWRMRLGELITFSDTVVFVLSPESAYSPVCDWEIEKAQSQGKRIIPVVRRPLGDIKPPDRIANLQYIAINDEIAGYRAGLDRLIKELNTETEWHREHTRLLVRATEWEAAGRPETRLLYGDDVYAANAWAWHRPRTSAELTNLHLDYIRTSETYFEFQSNLSARALREREARLMQREHAFEEVQREATKRSARVDGLLDKMRSSLRRSRRVDASAFCPRRLRAGEVEIVQVLVHLSHQRKSALKIARQADSRSYFAGPSKSIGELSIGDRVAISLGVEGARIIDEPETQVWLGETLKFAFRVAADGQSKHVAFNAMLSINGVHVGRIIFTRPVTAHYTLSDFLSMIRSPRLSRYKRVFFSYSSDDRPYVLRTAADYEKYGVTFFQDILSLDPGERWRLRLWKEIDRCDIFLIFWSSHAAKSEWVIKEAERAWLRQARNRGIRPTIRPEVLEHPVPIPEQEWLREFHFNDPKYYRVR